jgi:hypothetical protein
LGLEAAASQTGETRLWQRQFVTRASPQIRADILFCFCFCFSFEGDEKGKFDIGVQCLEAIVSVAQILDETDVVENGES